MKNAIVILILSVFFYMLQTSLIPGSLMLVMNVLHFSFLAGQTINLVLILLIYLSFNRDLSGTLIWAILFGMIGRWFGFGWNGAQATSFFLVGLLCWVFRNHILLKDEFTKMIVAGCAFLIEGFVHFNFGQYLNQIPNAYTGMGFFFMVHVFLNALVAPLIFWFVHWIDLHTGGIDSRSRRSIIYDF